MSVDESSIRVSYKEDTREGFLRYAVLNVSWTRPHGTTSQCCVCNHDHPRSSFSFRPSILDFLHNSSADEDTRLRRIEQRIYLQ